MENSRQHCNGLDCYNSRLYGNFFRNILCNSKDFLISFGIRSFRYEERRRFGFRNMSVFFRNCVRFAVNYKGDFFHSIIAHHCKSCLIAPSDYNNGPFAVSVFNSDCVCGNIFSVPCIFNCAFIFAQTPFAEGVNISCGC